MNENLQNILILDSSLFLAILLFNIVKPKEINSIMGYRTRRSMKNKKNWGFAQNFFSSNWFIVIPLMLITQIPLIFDNSLSILLPVSIFEFTAYSILLIIITERKLKKM